jgi:hypothetical protein
MNAIILLRIPLFSFILFVGALFLSGCSSPQERSGVSHIPINHPVDQGARTFEGGL